MRAALVATLLLLAGCLAPAAPAPFDRVDAPWVAQVTSGCGMCSGQGGFRSSAEHYAFFVFEDGKLVEVEWNGGPGGSGVHVAGNVTFDRAQLAGLVRASPRAVGAAWVVRVTTLAGDPETARELREGWSVGAQDNVCTDSGISFLLRQENGTIERQDFTCGPLPPHPFAAFAEKMSALRGRAEKEGVTQGVPRAGS